MARGLQAILFLGLAFVAVSLQRHVHAQVPGVCVSGCNIPSTGAPSTGSPSGGQPLDPRMYWIGVSAAVSGDVTFIYPSGQRVPGNSAAQTPIPLGARVITGPGARVSFLLIDETGFSIGPNSELVMDRFVYDPSAAIPSRMALKILRGQFRFTTGKKARVEAQITTPVVNIGIRGTDFEVNADPGGSGYILVHQGQIEAAEFDTGKIFILNAGQRLRFENFQIVGVQ